MTERIVKVTVLAAVNSYLSGMDQVAKKAREGRSEAEQLTAKLEAQRKAFNIAGTTAIAAGGLIAAGLALAVAKAAEFDQAMSNVAATGQDARDNIEGLREAAIDAGARTVFSAKEAANAIEELAKAGVSAKDILSGGLNGALDLAAAGGLGVADAAGIAATALTQFKLKGDQASHVADLLAAGAGKAMGDVSDMSQALNQGGLVANQFGLSIEETTGTLAAFASNGLLGSDAGTSFKTMLQRLVPQSKQAQQTMDALGLSAFDSQGKFIGMTQYAGKLHNALSDMSDEQRNATLSVLFGSDAVRAASVIYDQGADGIQGWIDKVNDQGYAAETAATRLDNLKGDLEGLGGAFDSLLISVGESGQGPLRAMVQGLTDLINTFNDLPDGGKQAVFWVGAVTAAVLIGGGAFLLAVPKIAAYRAALVLLGPGAQRVDGVLRGLGRFLVGPWGIALAAGAVAVAALQQALKSVQASADEMKNSIETATSSADAIFKTASKGKEWGLQFDVLDRLKDLKGTLDGLIESDQNLWKRLPVPGGGFADRYGGAAQALKDVGTQLAAISETDGPAAARAFKLIADETDGSNRQLWALLANMPDYKDALVRQATQQGINLAAMSDSERQQALLNIALGEGTRKTHTAADAYKEQADKVNGVRDALRDLTDTINQENDAQLRAIEAKSSFAEGIAQLKGQVKEYGTSLDMSERKGLNNAAMLGDLATKAQESAQAQYELDQKTMGASEAAQKYADNLANQRKKLEDAAVAAGYSKDEVKKLLDTVFQLPDQKSITILANTQKASDAISNLIDTYDQKKITLQVKLKTGAKDSELAGLVGIGIPGRAGGGILPGPPSSTDNMLAAVASGEFIVRASQVTPPENRRVLEYINAGGRMRGYADGGYVQPTYSAGGSRSITVTAPSLDGVRISGTLDLGNGLSGYIDGRIMAADAAQAQAIARGKRG